MRKKKRKKIVKYSFFVIILSLFLFGVIIFRMFELSCSKKIDGTNLQKLASKRTMKTETIKAERGTIYSNNNNDVLAQNVSSYTLIAYLDPKRTTDKDNPQHVVDKEKTAEELAPILNISKDEILKYLNKENVYQTEFGRAGRNLSELEKAEIEKLKLPGIDFIESSKRYYPKGNFMSYTLGYATQDEDGNISGKMGLELYYDKILRGEDGKITYQKDLRGYRISGTKEYKEDAVNGKDIYLTIDSNVQFFIEQALKEAKENYGYEWFTMVVADAKTGAIIGMSSNPNFDPNTRDGITNYLDLTISNPYEPGSTMKTFTYMAAMENGVYDGNETYESGTYETSDGTVIGDWNRNGWGTITFDKGYALSSNVGVINLIKRHMNSAMLRSYFRRLGFGRKTGIQLPNEAKGSLNFKYETEIFNAGFGQGITTTPMQNIEALTSLTNNGVIMKPYLVKKIVDKDTGEVVYKGSKKEGERVASTNTVNKMISLMSDTVNGIGNTGSAYRIPSGELVGKTGTAQIASSDGAGYLTGKEDIISSFAGVYPKSDPEIIIYASVSRPTGGMQRPISNAVKEVVSNIAKYYGETVEETEPADNVTNYKMESFVNEKLDKAQTTLNAAGMTNIIVLGNGTNVINQYPEADSKITNKDKIFILTDGEKSIPDINGYSRSDAEHLLNLLGYKKNVTGKGYVTNYTVNGDTVTLELNPKFVESGG